MGFVDIKVRGMRETTRALKGLGAKGSRALGSALFTVAQTEILAKAKQLVPVITANLKDSGDVELPVFAGNQVSVDIFFGGAAAAYALAVHENPRAGKTGGISPQGKKYPAFSRVGQWRDG